MITHEEVKVIIKKVRSKKYCNIAELNKIIDYATQQEKKDKLLELYREKEYIFNYVVITPEGIKEKIWKLAKLKSEIKALEEELK